MAAGVIAVFQRSALQVVSRYRHEDNGYDFKRYTDNDALTRMDRIMDDLGEILSLLQGDMERKNENYICTLLDEDGWECGQRYEREMRDEREKR